MGIFARLATLIKANLNDLISRSEDPEKMLNQVVVDMQNQLIEAKKQVAVSIADEKRLAKQAEQEAANAAEWERRAMLAIKAGDDNLAKEALTRKKEHDTLAETLKTQWQKQKQSVDQLKQALRLLNSKIEEAKRKKNLLIAKQKRAQAQKRIHETMAGLNDRSAFETFDRMAERIEETERRALAAAEVTEALSGDSLEQEFQRLKPADQSVEYRLLQLKERMGLPAPGSQRAALPGGQKSNEEEGTVHEAEYEEEPETG